MTLATLVPVLRESAEQHRRPVSSGVKGEIVENDLPLEQTSVYLPM